MVAAFVQGLRRRLARDKWALVKAADMRRVLSPLCATSEAELAQFWNDATPQVDEEGRQVYCYLERRHCEQAQFCEQLVTVTSE